MSTKREILSRNLQRLLENTYMNQTQLADLCSVSGGTFSDWVNGRNYPRPDKLTTLAKVLGVTEYDLTTDFEHGNKREYMNREVAEIANELYNNPDARGLYSEITKLYEEDLIAVKQLVMRLPKKNF